MGARVRTTALVLGCCAAGLGSAGAAERSQATPTACHDLFRVEQILPFRGPPFGHSVVVGRFDANRRADIATAGSSDSVRVFLADADGHLRAAGQVPAAPPMMSLVAGELTGDGRTDLVGADGGAITVLAGDGNGHFALRAQTPSPSSYVQALGDLSSDANTDVVTTTNDPSGAYLRLLLGDGTGALRESAAFPIATNWFGPAAVADLDGDGRADVLLGGRAGTTALQMLPGDGSGGLRAAVAANNGLPSVAAIALADFNQDARVDVATLGFGVANVLLGDGRGHFTPSRRQSPLGVGDVGGGQSLVAADFNGDGLADLAVAGNDNGDVFVYLNRSKGRFRLAEGAPEYGGIYPSAPLAVGDVDGDGRPDLVGLRGGGAPALRVLRNTGGRTPPHVRAQTITMIEPRPDELVQGDDVTISARLRCHPGSLALFRRPLRHRRAAWRRLETVRTNYRGVAEVSDRPQVTSEYQWRPTGRGKGRIKRSRQATVRVVRGGGAAD